MASSTYDKITGTAPKDVSGDSAVNPMEGSNAKVTSESYAKLSATLHGCVDKFDVCAKPDSFSGSLMTSGSSTFMSSNSLGRRLVK